MREGISMFPQSFEEFMRMLYEQFSGGSGLKNLSQPQQRRMDSPAAPYGISMTSPFLRGSSGVKPLPQVRDGARPAPTPASPVQSAPTGFPNFKPLPQVRDGGFSRAFNPAQGRAYEEPSIPRVVGGEEEQKALDERRRRLSAGGNEFRSGTIWG